MLGALVTQLPLILKEDPVDLAIFEKKRKNQNFSFWTKNLISVYNDWYYFESSYSYILKSIYSMSELQIWLLFCLEQRAESNQLSYILKIFQ